MTLINRIETFEVRARHRSGSQVFGGLHLFRVTYLTGGYAYASAPVFGIGRDIHGGAVNAISDLVNSNGCEVVSIKSKLIVSEGK